jgi:RNase P subunit RPR2
MFTEFKKRRFKDGKQTVVKKPPVKVVFEEPVERKPIVICEKCKKENRKVLMKYREAQNNIVFSCPSCKDIIRKPKEKPTKGSVNVGNKPKTKEIDPTKTNKPFIR